MKVQAIYHAGCGVAAYANAFGLKSGQDRHLTVQIECRASQWQ
jgi:hypothetical protein